MPARKKKTTAKKKATTPARKPTAATAVKASAALDAATVADDYNEIEADFNADEGTEEVTLTNRTVGLLIEDVTTWIQLTNKVNTERKALNETATSATGHAIIAAIRAQTVANFEEFMSSIFGKIRSNEDNLAIDLGCALAKKQPKDGAPVYVVPNTVMSTKSKLKSALECGLELGTVDDPVTYSSIRDQLKDIKAEEDAAKATPEQKILAQCLAALDEIRERVTGKMDPKRRAALYKAVDTAVRTGRGGDAKNVRAPRKGTAKTTAAVEAKAA